MDHNLTKQIGAWLDTPEEQRDLEEGALLVLRLSNNRIMYQNFERNLKRSAKMIAYQLQKYYNFRVKDLTHEEVAIMREQVAEIAEKNNLAAIPVSEAQPSGESEGEEQPTNEIAEIRKGKRVDHDSLPAEIQALYVENLSLLQRMRNLHAKLELLSTENATCPDSERYPFLKEIIALDKKYHENWYSYDHFNASAASPSAQDSADNSAETRPESESAASKAKAKTTRKAVTKKAKAE